MRTQLLGQKRARVLLFCFISFIIIITTLWSIHTFVTAAFVLVHASFDLFDFLSHAPTVVLL